MRIAFILSLTLLPLTTIGADFIPLVGVPFMEQAGDKATLADYANAFYIAAISLGAVVAVLKIIFAGVKYVLTDVVTDKSEAKRDIKGALLGLVLIIGAVLLLNTISPNITTLQAFNLTALKIERPPPTPPRTEADQCPDGQDFVKTNDNPDGACVSETPIPGGGDYTDSPELGEQLCRQLGLGDYNQSSNKCGTTVMIYAVDDYVIRENLSSVQSCEGDTTCIVEALDVWCSTTFSVNDITSTPLSYKYDAANDSCVLGAAL